MKKPASSKPESNAWNPVLDAVYARVSTEGQEERQTIESQLNLARAYCDAQGITAEFYVDDGVTGMLELGDRPEGARLMEDAHAGRIGKVIVYKLDRLGRGNDARLVLNAVYGLRDAGVSVVSLTESIDTSTPAGQLFIGMLASIAAYERQTILQRTQLGIDRAAAAGRWLGGVVPYGYRVNEKGFLEISEEPIPGVGMSEADVIRMIYRLLADEGKSCLFIAGHLNALGILPSYIRDQREFKRGKRIGKTQGVWYPGRVRNMIASPVYHGRHEYGRRSSKDREVIVREVPAIVSHETWERAQKMLKRNQLDALRNCKHNYLLRGLIKCASCGRMYRGAAFSYGQKGTKLFYVCGGKDKLGYTGMQEKCTAKNIPGEWMDQVIWDLCEQFLLHPDETVTNWRASQATLTQQDATRLRKEHEGITRAMANPEIEREKILELYRRGIIGIDDVERELRKIESARAVLQERLQEVNKQLIAVGDQGQDADTLKKILRTLRKRLNDGLTIDAKREIIRSLITGITVETIGEVSSKRQLTARVTITTIMGNVNI